MSLNLEVHNIRRVVPLRFRRAINGPPDAQYPPLDDRGYAAAAHADNSYHGPYHGPVVGMLQGSEISITLVREMIGNNAPLTVTSSNPSVLTISLPHGGTLPNQQDMHIHLHAAANAIPTRSLHPLVVKVQVHYKNSGVNVLLHELSVWIFYVFTVNITAHFVTIGKSGAAHSGIAPIANVNAIMQHVHDIWRPCGIRPRVVNTVHDAVNFAGAGVVSDGPNLAASELNILLQTNWKANTINVYFVHQIGSGTTLGYGFSRQSFAGFGVANPGILLGDMVPGFNRPNTMSWGNDLAHEVGHFFTLWHPENKQPPSELEDTWSRQKLMHNFNPMGGHTAPGAQPRFDDVGYGHLARGCFLTLKDLPQLTSDNECLQARQAINSVHGPY